MLVGETPWRWRIERHGDMRVPGILFASESLLPDVVADRSLDQVVNVATLPGIVEASYAMPDIHWGYGFAIGGVAATDVDEDGVISPGGVGFDISCGVRLLTVSHTGSQLGRGLAPLMDELEARLPKGMGPGAAWDLTSDEELDAVLTDGPAAALARGFGNGADLLRCEDHGALGSADPTAVGEKARARGMHQLGSIGSGNHFVEVQRVAEIHDETAAAGFGLARDQICVMIHTGSRGLGHQVCTDHVDLMRASMSRYRIRVPDPQLACVPVQSPEGQEYLAAMAAAANYGRTNRHMLAVAVREAFTAALGPTDVDLLYDVSHNLAKLEDHVVDGRRRRLCVHRKGATPALPPGDPGLPVDLAPYGQPVLVPGSMGTASYVLAGVAGSGAFHSSCHGAGRTMSRTAARKQVSGSRLRSELATRGIEVRAGSVSGLAEEAPRAYKDVDAVVETVERAGLARRVARLIPLGVVKG